MSAFTFPTFDVRAAQAVGRKWAEVFRLPFRQKRWQGQSGEMAGSGVGSSLEFQDHRAYLPGDDPRQINWQAYARTGHYTMKLYREEVRPLVDVVLDVSDSMFAYETKGRRALETFYFVAEAARRAGATLRVFLVKGAAVQPLPEESVAAGRWWAEKEKLPPTGPHEAVSLARVPFRGGAMRVLVSDLLFPGEPEAIIQTLAARQGRGLVFAPVCREEAHPDWDGNYEFIEAESRQPHLHRLDPGQLRRYEAAYARHFDLWKACAAKYGLPLARVPAEPDLGVALRAEAVPASAVEA